MLELFSRKPDCLILGDDSYLTPIPIVEDVSSLSAILMDEDYYQFIHQHKIEINSISIVKPECLIPLKAKAWLDMKVRQADGKKVDSKDIRKHRNDIFRLFQVVKPDSRIQLANSIANDMKKFLKDVSEEKDLSLKDLNLGELTVIYAVETLTKVYQLTDLQA